MWPGAGTGPSLGGTGSGRPSCPKSPWEARQGRGGPLETQLGARTRLGGPPCLQMARELLGDSRPAASQPQALCPPSQRSRSARGLSLVPRPPTSLARAGSQRGTINLPTLVCFGNRNLLPAAGEGRAGPVHQESPQFYRVSALEGGPTFPHPCHPPHSMHLAFPPSLHPQIPSHQQSPQEDQEPLGVAGDIWYIGLFLWAERLSSDC